MLSPKGHSAIVAMKLLIGDIQLGLSHVGSSGFVVADDCGPIPACEAQIVVSIDGRERTTNVFLPHGIPGPRLPVTFI